MRHHSIDIQRFEGAAISCIPQPPPIRREPLGKEPSFPSRSGIHLVLLAHFWAFSLHWHPSRQHGMESKHLQQELKSKSSRLTRTLLAGSNMRKSPFVKSSAGWFKSLGLHRNWRNLHPDTYQAKLEYAHNSGKNVRWHLEGKVLICKTIRARQDRKRRSFTSRLCGSFSARLFKDSSVKRSLRRRPRLKRVGLCDTSQPASSRGLL